MPRIGEDSLEPSWVTLASKDAHSEGEHAELLQWVGSARHPVGGDVECPVGWRVLANKKPRCHQQPTDGTCQVSPGFR